MLGTEAFIVVSLVYMIIRTHPTVSKLVTVVPDYEYDYPEDEMEEIESEELIFTNKNQTEIEKMLVDWPRNFTVAADGSQTIVRTVQRQYFSYKNPNVPFRRTALFSRGLGSPDLIEKKIIDEKIEHSVTYKLYNSKAKGGKLLTYGNSTVNPVCTPGENAVFVIHGYLQSGEHDPIVATIFQTSLNIKNAYIKTNRTENVIVVNWELKANQLNYIAAAMDTYLVGIALGHMIVFLKTENCFDYNQVKLVGFSLGAHVAGVAGHFINEKLKIKIAEITGLDPAGPFFDPLLNLKYRLDKGDANFVQIIHCNMGNILSVQVGSILVAGHADFFPNGGAVQLNCNRSLLAYSNVCSHLRCGELYSSSVRGVAFNGCSCSNVDKFMKDNCTNPVCTCNGPAMGDLCPKKEVLFASTPSYLRYDIFINTTYGCFQNFANKNIYPHLKTGNNAMSLLLMVDTLFPGFSKFQLFQLDFELNTKFDNNFVAIFSSFELDIEQAAGFYCCTD